jgi:plastocyanin
MCGRASAARVAHGTHPCCPETLTGDSGSMSLQLVAMRRAAPRRDAVVVKLAVGLTTILATLALAGSTFAATKAKTLTGTVGPGFTISMNKKTVKAGKYVITIHDLASIHDFHLTGPGVAKKTSVSGTGTTKWTVKLKRGMYHFVCDPHRTIMHGVLKVT